MNTATGTFTRVPEYERRYCDAEERDLRRNSHHYPFNHPVSFDEWIENCLVYCRECRFYVNPYGVVYVDWGTGEDNLLWPLTDRREIERIAPLEDGHRADDSAPLACRACFSTMYTLTPVTDGFLLTCMGCNCTEKIQSDS